MIIVLTDSELVKILSKHVTDVAVILVFAVVSGVSSKEFNRDTNSVPVFSPYFHAICFIVKVSSYLTMFLYLLKVICAVE